MHEKQVYEYAVIRIVPLVDKEEFINAGVILFCKRSKFLKAVYKLDKHRLLAVCESANVDQIQLNLESVVKIAAAQKDSGPIGAMEIAERFRWMTAIRSTVIQTSRPHPGKTSDPEATLQRLFEEYVL